MSVSLFSDLMAEAITFGSQLLPFNVDFVSTYLNRWDSVDRLCIGDEQCSNL